MDLPDGCPPMLTCRRYYRRLFLSRRLAALYTAFYKDFLSRGSFDVTALVDRGGIITTEKEVFYASDVPDNWQTRTVLLFVQQGYQNLRRLLHEKESHHYPYRLPSLSNPHSPVHNSVHFGDLQSAIHNSKSLHLSQLDGDSFRDFSHLSDPYSPASPGPIPHSPFTISRLSCSPSVCDPANAEAVALQELDFRRLTFDRQPAHLPTFSSRSDKIHYMPPRIQQELEHLLASTSAEVGLAFHDLARGDEILIHPDIPYHPASTIKVCVMMEAFHQAATGEFSLDDFLLVTNKFHSIADGSLFPSRGKMTGRRIYIIIFIGASPSTISLSA